MKKVIYAILKPVIRTAFQCYYQRISFKGMGGIPADKPVVLLPNHQNALLDPLLYAAFARARKPYFLTRSDVFQGGLLEAFFDAMRMIPIYRWRDGRHTLRRNDAVFDRCAELLSQGEHLLLFPEANHNLRRQVRPLSKGFTRIVARAMECYPDLDLQLVPVGINYQDAAGFPDRVTYVFGTPIAARELWEGLDEAQAAAVVKQRIFEALTTLTTHADPDREYEAQILPLEEQGADFNHPEEVNAYLKGATRDFPRRSKGTGLLHRLWDGLFRLLNAPVVLPWGWVARNKVWEPEFMSTFRFGFAFLVYPLYYLALLLLLGWLAGWATAGVAVAFLIAFNLLYVKGR
ncbi:1-acyl-sn-glycerol-3-phosphate acyltransferase [Robiginitalea sediminis]|uniref:1-acyl-sn-glycerol-3-phosphate acyltransferase n=1 Tax=Robiginitalea sediminis TaxID=1982593 RepID=UPI000B4BA382|nr:1-acyl-sn-glycerol-3-phosphate acyltransferase [Robiginitalea sediminis]